MVAHRYLFDVDERLRAISSRPARLIESQATFTRPHAADFKEVRHDFDALLFALFFAY